jgi:hypothetical protein
MVEVGIAEYFSIGEALGIIGPMFVVLYFSRKHMQRVTVDRNKGSKRFGRKNANSYSDAS